MAADGSPPQAAIGRCNTVLPGAGGLGPDSIARHVEPLHRPDLVDFGRELDGSEDVHCLALLLCGGLTDVCVHYTFVDGHQSDYFCRVIEDCVAGSSEHAHEGALRAMEYLQTGARRSLAEVLHAMDGHRERPATAGSAMDA